MNNIITEITPLSEKDCFYVVDRYKDSFSYPLHRHQEFELNFLENCKGARRIVGDSIEVLADYDLAIVGNNIEHVWEQHECKSKKIREITIQFSPGLFAESFLSKNQLNSIQKLLNNSSHGIAFDMSTIMKVYGLLDDLTSTQSDFYRVIKIMTILYELSIANNSSHVLSSSSFASLKVSGDSRRVLKVEEFINKHYKEEIRLNELADMVGMSATAFSRFFKLRTGKTICDYVIDIRLGFATRQLVDTTSSIAEICYGCGFNNVSNFNRIFKKKKGCSPKVFRENYQRHKMII